MLRMSNICFFFRKGLWATQDPLILISKGACRCVGFWIFVWISFSIREHRKKPGKTDWGSFLVVLYLLLALLFIISRFQHKCVKHNVRSALLGAVCVFEMRLNSFLLLFFRDSPSFFWHTRQALNYKQSPWVSVRVCCSKRALALSPVDSQLKGLRPGSNLMAFCFKWPGLFHMDVLFAHSAQRVIL